MTSGDPLPLSILFAGGGTGGHLYPGLAIAEQISSNSTPTPRCLFLCSDRPIDRSILTTAGAAFEVIPAKPMIFRPRGLARFIASWGPSLRAARALIRKERREGRRVVMASMGGFVAAPCAQAARAERIPIVMVNLDAVPGKANRWIARRADRVISAIPTARGWETIPPIVRREAIASAGQRECRMALGLEPDRHTLLVTGGSQGATSINRFMTAFARANAAVLQGWQIIHQAGKDAAAEVESAYRGAGINASVREFLNPMATAWGAADLAVARCGAGTVAELWANRVPSLLLPYPFHRDDHQRANARVLEEAGAAIVRTDHVDPSKNLADAGRELTTLLADPSRLATMRASAQSLPPPDGARWAAEAILDAARLASA